MSVKSIEIAWLAGILEGEGTFIYHNSATIRLHMNDIDIVRKVAGLFKRPYYKEDKRRQGLNDSYYVTIHGGPAIEWMFTIYSLMGERRKNRIREIINEWKNSESFYFDKNNFKCGHPRNNFNSVSYGRISRCRICKNSKNMQYRLRNKNAS